MTDVERAWHIEQAELWLATGLRTIGVKHQSCDHIALTLVQTEWDDQELEDSASWSPEYFIRIAQYYADKYKLYELYGRT